MHAALIALHAIAGLTALVVGGVATRRVSFFGTYFWSLTACILLLAGVIAGDWSDLDASSRALFTAFVALGVYMIWRATQALRLLPTMSDQLSSRYLDHLGFTLVALLDAFIVIVVLGLGGPPWLLVSTGGLIAAGAHRTIITLKRRLTPATSAPGHQGSFGEMEHADGLPDRHQDRRLTGSDR
ncbi:MAG: hypothetical protein ACR2OB_06545 [Solirubrobacteraceae bacterium]